MSGLDNLIGSHLSLISLQDARYDGVLFSINAEESSIVLQNGICLKYYYLKILLMTISCFCQ